MTADARFLKPNGFPKSVHNQFARCTGHTSSTSTGRDRKTAICVACDMLAEQWGGVRCAHQDGNGRIWYATDGGRKRRAGLDTATVTSAGGRHARNGRRERLIAAPAPCSSCHRSPRSMSAGPGAGPGTATALYQPHWTSRRGTRGLHVDAERPDGGIEADATVITR